MKKIAIIGAGMAGLTALQQLKEAGHHVTLFDKSRGSGGRMSAKMVGAASWDMGAQFMRAHTPEFQQQLQQWQSQGWVSPWSMTPMLINKDGAQSSPDDVQRFVGMPRMTGLSRQLVSAADVFLTQTRIVKTKFDDHWYLTDDNDVRFGPFDGLIVNTPPLQAQPLVPTSCDFHSHLGQQEMLPCWSLLLAFQQPLDGDLADKIEGAFVKDSPLAWISKNSAKPGRDSIQTWVIHANSAWSSSHLETPREEIISMLKEAFFDALRCSPQTPSEHWVHRWLYSIPANKLDVGAYIDESCHLAVCGDWCQSGSIEGAWLSGLAAAQPFLPD
ncbi:MAG: FAD-dependent oxidoreductase [Oleibacter sp.]|nr:FAD-dependent oxidoreductase [Thalassolituus sp.]